MRKCFGMELEFVVMLPISLKCGASREGETNEPPTLQHTSLPRGRINFPDFPYHEGLASKC